MFINRDQGLTLAIVAGLISVAVFGMWLPKRMKEAGLHDRAKAAKSELVDVKKVVAQREPLVEEVLRLETEVSSVRRYVPESRELASLLRELSLRLEKHQVLDQSIQTAPVQSGVEYEVIPVVVRFRGKPMAVYSAIREIESMRRLNRVTRLRITEGTDRDDRGKHESMLSVQMDLSTFSAPSTTGGGEETRG